MGRRATWITGALCALVFAVLVPAAVHQRLDPGPAHIAVVADVGVELAAPPAPPPQPVVLPGLLLLLAVAAGIGGPVGVHRSATDHLPVALGVAHPRLLRWHATMLGAPPRACER